MDTPVFAALDLGTNNCRLLIVKPIDKPELSRHGETFRVVESFSRIVRLGEGLETTGALNPRAMERTLAALKICAEKLKQRRPQYVRAITTQACRIATNGKTLSKGSKRRPD